MGGGIKVDWVITDVPYGIKADNFMSKKGGQQCGEAKAKHRFYEETNWDSERIGSTYFELMQKCSDNQLIFGGSYYTDILPPTKGWVVWDKRLPSKADRNDYGDCELAWCSKGVARVFNYMYNGMLQDDRQHKDNRFHPTQKPTQLWSMLLNFYTKEGDTILDPFAGSQSLRIACYRLNRHYIGCEIDKNYFELGNKWFAEESSKPKYKISKLDLEKHNLSVKKLTKLQ